VKVIVAEPPFEQWLPAQASRDDVVGKLARRLHHDAQAPQPWTFRNLANYLEREERFGDLMTLALARAERLRPFPWSLLRSDRPPTGQEEHASMSWGLCDRSEQRRRRRFTACR
jgi:hypothetical protein